MAQKKSFKNDLNPAMRFISTPAESAEKEAVHTAPAAGKAPEGYKVNPLYIETKSKRLQLLIQPSLLKQVKARARREGLSVNELIHSILEEATQGEE